MPPMSLERACHLSSQTLSFKDFVGIPGFDVFYPVVHEVDDFQLHSSAKIIEDHAPLWYSLLDSVMATRTAIERSIIRAIVIGILGYVDCPPSHSEEVQLSYAYDGSILEGSGVKRRFVEVFSKYGVCESYKVIAGAHEKIVAHARRA
ncbi:hypothetical protein J1614_008187 [Plenodomus biglobosus]|nr:hypothetical protein J1614_008187 [Plenodomus biglobosus]